MKTKKLAPVHPGEILFHDFMGPLGLSQYALAKALDVAPMRISQIVRGQRAVTVDTALRLSRYFGTRPAWWMDLQTHYDLETAADKLEARIARAVKPCGLRPMPELVPALGKGSAICPRRGWRLGGVGPFGVVACGQAAAVTTGELLADAELIH